MKQEKGNKEISSRVLASFGIVSGQLITCDLQQLQSAESRTTCDLSFLQGKELDIQDRNSQKEFQLIDEQSEIVSKKEDKMAPYKGKNVKPSEPISAFEYFTRQYREMEMKRLGPAFDSTVFAKNCAQVYPQRLNREQLMYFNNLAEQDNVRYRAELEAYRLRRADPEKQKKPKKVKDTNAPKKPLTSFFWFCNEERATVKQMNPEFKGPDLAKELGRLWKGLGGEEKRKYETMAQRDKERYQRELTAYTNATAAVVSTTTANFHQQSGQSQHKFPRFVVKDTPK